MKYKTADIIKILRGRYQSYGAESLRAFLEYREGTDAELYGSEGVAEGEWGNGILVLKNLYHVFIKY